MINNVVDFKKDLEISMNKCIDNFKVNINKIYIGRVSASILDSVMVEYYGDMIPISQLTNSIVENPRTLAMTVFDPKMVQAIRKAIINSNLEILIAFDKNVIRVTLPLLTESRRHTLIKMARVESEKSKISIRNVRRISNDKIKILLKNKRISKDDEHHYQNEIQDITNTWIKKIDSILHDKESELIRF